MSLFEALFRLFAFVTLMSTPKITDAMNSKREIASLELFAARITRLMLDYSIRVVLLFSVGLGLEYLFGNELYESFMIDYALVVIVILGGVHWCVFGVLSGLNLAPRLRYTLYRAARNACFAPMPGLFLVVPVLAWEFYQGYEPYESGFAYQVYCVATITALVLGLAEALLSKTAPTGFQN